MWKTEVMSSRRQWIWLAAGYAAVGLAVSGCQRAESMAGDAVYEIDVPDISCQGCAGALEEALDEVDGVAEVRVDVAAKSLKVGVDSALVADDGVLREAIRGAGYSPDGE